MSGHNKWSSIKHRKGAQDAKRGRMFTKIIKEVTIAARVGGGDIDGNPRLRRAVDLAKAANMPNDTLARAIKKGTGELEGVTYEELIYEGVGPAGSLFIMDVLTDNRNRTAAEVRKIFDKHNGQLGSTGSAAWAFDEKGLIDVPHDAASEEGLFEIAAGAGAEDLTQQGDRWVVTTSREDLDAVSTAIAAAGIPVLEAQLARVAKTPKLVSGNDAGVLMNLVEALEDHDDVQKVFADFELSDDALAALEAER